MLDLILLFREYYYNARDAALVITSPMQLEHNSMKDILVSKFSQLPNFDPEQRMKEFSVKYENTVYKHWFVPFETTLMQFRNRMPMQDQLRAFEMKSITNTNTLTLLHQFTLPNKVS